MNAQGVTQTDYGHPLLIEDGPFAGWRTWGGGADPFETAIGPFCYRVIDSKVRCGFQPRREHLNGAGAVHGGALMSFADFALFAIAYNALDASNVVTVTCNSEFLSAGGLEGVIEAEGEMLRETRSLLFIRGLVTQQGRPLLAFSGTLKKIVKA